MVSKPKSWETIPNQLLEDILWDIDDLDYCTYESSKAECINEILNGVVSSTNGKIINAYWKALSDERFENFVRNKLVSAKRLVEQLETLLNS